MRRGGETIAKKPAPTRTRARRRLNREAEPTFTQLHVPTSCCHCEDPHCMKDCPPDAIYRAPNGEVFIQDHCIGCGNCERNCPYNVIQMAAMTEPAHAGAVVVAAAWSVDGIRARRKMLRRRSTRQPKVAVKCDMCKVIAGGAACVRACPTGAALRVSPREIPRLRERGRGLARDSRACSLRALTEPIRAAGSHPRQHHPLPINNGMQSCVVQTKVDDVFHHLVRKAAPPAPLIVQERVDECAAIAGAIPIGSKQIRQARELLCQCLWTRLNRQ